MPQKVPPNDRLQILCVGHAAFTVINRRFYRALASCGYTVELVIPKVLPFMGEKMADSIEDKDPVIHWTGIRGANNRSWKFTDLELVLEKRRPLLIYLENDPASLMAIAVSKWAARNDASLVCYINENNLPPIIHSLLNSNIKDAVRTIRFKFLSYFSRRDIHTIFAICSDGVEAMKSIRMSSRTVVMPLGFDTDLFYPNDEVRARTRASLFLWKPTIAYFGRIDSRKGVHILLDALEKIKELEWQFLIDEFQVDTNSYSRLINQRITEEDWIAKRTVRFSASHVEMPAFMNACDIAVLPSIWKEQYGRVIPEAMGCAKAVIVSNAGALPEIVGDAGVIVAKNNSQELSYAIRKLLESPELIPFYGAKAHKRASEKLSIQAQIQVVEPVIKDILYCKMLRSSKNSIHGN